MVPDPATQINADPDPATQINADPDPATQINAYPDPATQINADPDPQPCDNDCTDLVLKYGWHIVEYELVRNTGQEGD